jgi:hypothetical protein
VGFDFVGVSEWVMVTDGLLWLWIGGNLPGCGGDAKTENIQHPEVHKI